MEERVYQPMNKVVVAYVNRFEKERRQVAFHYPWIDFSPLDPFKVVFNGELINEE